MKPNKVETFGQCFRVLLTSDYFSDFLVMVIQFTSTNIYTISFLTLYLFFPASFNWSVSREEKNDNNSPLFFKSLLIFLF